MSHGPQTGAAHSERKGDAVRLRWASADGPGAAPDGGALDALVESILVADFYAPPDA